MREMEHCGLCFDEGAFGVWNSENQGMGQIWDDKQKKVWYNSNMKKGQHKDLLEKQVLFALYKEV